MATAAERICVVLLLVYLAWVPMPFGSNIDAAFLPLVVPPMILFAGAALLRLRDHDAPHLTFPYRAWTAGAVVFIMIVAWQLVPMPRPLLALVSPHSNAIWSSADRIASLAGVPFGSAHPISIDPIATRHELLRLIAMFAAMQASALLIITNARRLAFAATLAIVAIFETLYGVREAAMQRYAIWGWVNRLIFNRVTGTFVNPNHFAHYVALALPFTMFIAALAWRHTGATTMPLQRRMVLLFEKSLPLFSASIFAFVGCVAGILLAQSRGALAATIIGFIAVAIIVARRERHPDRIQDRNTVLRQKRRPAGVIAGIIILISVIVSLIFFLGYERTVARFEPNSVERSTLVGRVTGIEAAFAIWREFPIFGCGFGAFADVVSTVQRNDLEHVYQHAHDDYAEILATTGIAGFCVAAAALFAGLIQIVRDVIRRPRESGSWRRRAFEVAALWSIFIAMTHALFDFNLFIPANAATLAAIAGACASTRIKVVTREASVSSS